MLTLVATLFFTAADIQLVQEYQNHLMELFTEGISTHVMETVAGSPRQRDVCQWYESRPTTLAVFSTECTGGVLRKVILQSIRQLFRPEFLPNTVGTFVMTDCIQKYKFPMRQLPAAARAVDISHNQLYGRLDLTVLPAALETLDVSTNQFTGPINLTRLPQTLVELKLTYNRISQRTLYYGNLPKGLLFVSLMGCDIRAAKPIDKSQEVRVGEVFPHLGRDRVVQLCL